MHVSLGVNRWLKFPMFGLNVRDLVEIRLEHMLTGAYS